MLRFPGIIIPDEKAEKYVKEYVNGRLIKMMDEIFCAYNHEGYESISETDMDFADCIRIFFPKGYPVEKMNMKFFGLYSLLKSEKEYVPQLAMEYALDQLIELKLDEYRLLEQSPTESMPEHDYVYRILLRDCTPDEATGIMDVYENMENYLEVCFWDSDFALLDEFTEEEIRNSPMNEMLGIMPRWPDNVFILRN